MRHTPRVQQVHIAKLRCRHQREGLRYGTVYTQPEQSTEVSGV